MKIRFRKLYSDTYQTIECDSFDVESNVKYVWVTLIAHIGTETETYTSVIDYEILEDKKNIETKNTTSSTEDVVNNPPHYKLNKHECIDEMIQVFGVEDVKAFCRCNIWKYRYRASAKNGEEDLKKAEWYMDKLEQLNNKCQ